MDFLLRLSRGGLPEILTVVFLLLSILISSIACILILRDSKFILNKKWLNYITGVFCLITFPYLASIIGVLYNWRRFKWVALLSTLFMILGGGCLSLSMSSEKENTKNLSELTKNLLANDSNLIEEIEKISQGLGQQSANLKTQSFQTVPLETVSLKTDNLDIDADLELRENEGKVLGVLVTNISPGSKFEQAGLKDLDLIRAVNGNFINKSSEISKITDALKSKKPFKFWVERNGTIKSLNVSLREGKLHLDSFGADKMKISGESKVIKNENAKKKALPEENLRLKNLVRTIPFYRDGKDIGQRLFEMKCFNLFYDLGLQNGDVILSVNGNSLAGKGYGFPIFEAAENETELSIEFDRNGKVEIIDEDLKDLPIKPCNQ